MYCARSSFNVATCHGMSNLGLFTLILTFSHQRRRNQNLAPPRPIPPRCLSPIFPRPFVGEGQGEGASFPSSSGVAKAT